MNDYLWQLSGTNTFMNTKYSLVLKRILFGVDGDKKTFTFEPTTKNVDKTNILESTNNGGNLFHIKMSDY